MWRILCWLGLHKWTRWVRQIEHTYIQERVCENCGFVQEKVIQ